MTVHTLTKREFEQLQTLVINLGDGTAQLQPGYSGRAMYGDQCLALIGDVSHLVRFALSLGEEAQELFENVDEAADDGDAAERLRELVDALRGQSTRHDSMGRSTVYYWPGVEVER